MAIHYDPSWQPILKPLFETPQVQALSKFIQNQRVSYTVYPPEEFVFRALQLTPLPQVKVVILGQDPYHGPGQAHGLSFSVPKGVAIPPSLRNMYTELSQDIPGFVSPEHGDLSEWARQGVLLLNATLTVQAHQAGSHQKRGWEYVTDQIIGSISELRTGVVFILWGAYAGKKSILIDSNKHLVLKSAHPSPLSAYRGFFGCKHFSSANAYLKLHHGVEIDWQI